jgi:hypothetical protein
VDRPAAIAASAAYGAMLPFHQRLRAFVDSAVLVLSVWASCC